jgi:hypothetical protein
MITRGCSTPTYASLHEMLGVKEMLDMGTDNDRPGHPKPTQCNAIKPFPVPTPLVLSNASSQVPSDRV